MFGLIMDIVALVATSIFVVESNIVTRAIVQMVGIIWANKKLSPSLDKIALPNIQLYLKQPKTNSWVSDDNAQEVTRDQLA